VTYTLANFPPNATVLIMWQRNSGSVFHFATTTTDASGVASGRFRVPAVTGGPNQTIFFVAGDVTKRVTIEVRPRIKVLTQPAVCGEVANISLRGYAKKETVRIRWKVGDDWVQLATVVTSNTGSANIAVTVPTSAADGLNSVRGDGAIFRQQTNAVVVQCGPATLSVVSEPGDPWTDGVNSGSAVLTYDNAGCEAVDSAGFCISGIWPSVVSIPGAHWIWKSQNLTPDEATSGTLLITFQKDFSLPADATGISGTITITVDDGYELFLNGVSLGADNDWTTPETYTISAESGLLSPGQNTIVVRATSIGRKESNSFYNPSGVLFRADITYMA
jgi:hypothetical protein